MSDTTWRLNNNDDSRGERGWEGRVSMVMEMQKRHMETQGEMDRKTVGGSTVAREEGRGGDCGEKNEVNWRKGKVETKERDVTKEANEREREKGRRRHPCLIELSSKTQSMSASQPAPAIQERSMKA